MFLSKRIILKLAEINLRLLSMNKSSVSSILEDKFTKALHDGLYFLKFKTKQFSTVYHIGSVASKPGTGCFGDVKYLYLRDEIKGKPLIWTIPTSCFNFPEGLIVLDAYLNWIKSHPSWVEGIEIIQEETKITVTFPNPTNKVRFHWVINLLRKISWHPQCIFTWWVMINSDLEFTDNELIFMPHYVNFPELQLFKNWTGPDDGHFLLGMNKGDFYSLDFDFDEKLQHAKDWSMFGGNAVSPLFFPSVTNAEEYNRQQRILYQRFSGYEGINYEKAFSNRPVHGSAKVL